MNLYTTLYINKPINNASLAHLRPGAFVFLEVEEIVTTGKYNLPQLSKNHKPSL